MTGQRDKIYKIPIKEVKKPFISVDVKEYDKIFIEGYTFPIDITSDKLIVKDNRKIKPPKKHHEMLKKLKESGITFNKEEESKILETLHAINYYRLSVFSLYLKEDKSYTQLMNLYNFDRFLMESINKLIPSIEILIKTTLAYYLSMHFEGDEQKGTLAYLEDTIFKPKEVKNGKVKEMRSCFSEFISSKQDKDPSIKHHLEYYSGNIPIWVLVEHLTMGNISTFATYLNRPVRKAWVRSFVDDVNDAWIIEWIKTIQFLRNTGAHCSRFYGKKFNYNPSFHKNDIDMLPEKYQGEKGISHIDKLRHTFFGGLLIIKRFYQCLPVNEQKKWAVFLQKLDKRILEYNADIYFIGFPSNWMDVLRIG